MTDISLTKTALVGLFAFLLAFGAAVAGMHLVGTDTFGQGLLVGGASVAVVATVLATAPTGGDA